MYEVKDRVVKISNREGYDSRFVDRGTRGTVIEVKPPTDLSQRGEYPYIKVRFTAVPGLHIKGGDEWCYESELVRAGAWDAFVKENDRDPTMADVGETLNGIQTLNLYEPGPSSPVTLTREVPPIETKPSPPPHYDDAEEFIRIPDEIVGDGPTPHYDDYVNDDKPQAGEVVGVSYDPPGGAPGDDPQRVMVAERDGSFSWVMFIDDSTLRKMQPVGTVVTEYFPDALLGVSAVAWVGNEKHNPGERLHWARGKSFDHIDGEIRHGIDAARPGADGWDTITLKDGRVFQVRHKAAKAWRALADAQLDIESVNGQVIRRLK